MHLPCGLVPLRFTSKTKQKKRTLSIDEQQIKLILPDRFLSMTAKLKTLKVLPLQERCIYNTAVLLFKVHIMGWAPQYEFDLNRAAAGYESNENSLPRSRTDLCKTNFAFSGSSIWNSFPPKMEMNKSARGFKVNVRKILVNK